ncbi:ankyrin repeat-containing domain protein [Xylogone sp. PMI_703]|nr:ankyrin repeat-containing domain protein [Xylogone sp. PMI_703]
MSESTPDSDAESRVSVSKEEDQDSLPDVSNNALTDGDAAHRLPRQDGLLLMWSEDSGSTFDILTDYDVVVVHGIMGQRNPPWKNHGSGDSTWMTYRPWEGKRVFSFGYNVRQILVGKKTRQAIRRLAVKLMEQLYNDRKKDEKRRPIAFIAHDIGGIIVKDALDLYDGSSYGDIFDLTRLLIFYGCPHRSRGLLDMENRIARFLFGNFKETNVGNAVTVTSTKSLAAAILEINGVFIESKTILRTHVVSVYAGVDSMDVIIDPVFDVFCGTLGVPFERQIRCSVCDPDNIFQNRQKMLAQLTPDPRIFSHERLFINMASPIYPFLTAFNSEHPFYWIAKHETYQSWLDYPDPQLLYVHGNRGTREASEAIFYILDESRQFSEKNEVVVYFTFDKDDYRYDSAKDMLGTFLAQIINHYPTLAEFVLLQFQYLRRDRAFNESDLLSWFEYFRVRGQIDGVTCVINHFDECDEYSRGIFLREFFIVSKMHERPWKIVVTSRDHKLLENEMVGWPTIDLDAEKPIVEGDDDKDLESFSSHSAKLLPRLSLNEDLEEKQAEKIDEAEPEVRQVILEQERLRDDWKIDSGLQDMSLKSVLEQVLLSVPDANTARDILLWSLWTFRPLTIWEMAIVVSLDWPRTTGTEVTVNQDAIDYVVDAINTWFAGILRISDNEVTVVSRHVRETLKELVSPQFQSPEKTIAMTCLNYLQRENVKQLMEKEYSIPYTPAESETIYMEAPTFSDRYNFISYCTYHFAKHFARIPSELRSSELLKHFVESGSINYFSRAHWVLAHPIERSKRSQSLFPLFTALGLAEDAQPWINGDDDISRGLYEAALNGYSDVARSLLTRIDHPIPKLQEALTTASARGDEVLLLDIMDHICKKHDDFPWPISLLYRASWLGLSKVVTRLLDLGMAADPDPEQPLAPLHQAIRNGHVEVIKILLKRGADPMRHGPWGQSALHMASASGHAEITRLLGEAGADLNARDDNSFTPLYEASLWGNFKSVEVLVELGADTSLATSVEEGVQGWTPLIVASEEGHIRCVNLLLKANADPNLAGPHGTPLYYALRRSHEDVCQALLDHGADPNHPALDPPVLIQVLTDIFDEDKKARLRKLLVERGAKVDVVDFTGQSPLIYAAQVGDADCVRYLLDHGADVSVTDGSGRNALLYAVDYYRVEVVRLLLERGVKQHGTEQDELVPIFRAISNEELVKLLLEHGAETDVRSPFGKTPLMAAAETSNAAIVKLLLSYDAGVDLEMAHNKGDMYGGWTALAYGIEGGNEEIVRLLAEAGADVNHRLEDASTLTHRAVNRSTIRKLMEFRPDVNIADADDNMPLHLVRAWTPLEHAQLLVHAGATLDYQNKEGYTPLGIALYNRNDEIASYLIERRANVNIASQTFGAPLHLACQHSNVEMVQKLVDAGADVDLAVLGAPGTPLQATMLRPYDAGDIEPIIRYLIEDARADVNRIGGIYGTVLAIAALQGSSDVVSYLIDKSASPTLSDGMGRLPLHLAVTNGLAHVKSIQEAGADIKARDKTGRTILHWATQGGHLEVLNYVIKLLRQEDNFNIDDKDNDGWTALCWAARGCGIESKPIWGTAQVEILKSLLDNGADIHIQARFSTKEWWTPLQIAQYSGAAEEVIEFLTKASSKKTVDHSHEHEERELKRTNTFRRAGQKAYFHSGYRCMCCLGEIRGIRYQCKDCLDFNFCYKCYNSRRRLHIEGHLFDEIGPEFASTYGNSETSSHLESESDHDSDTFESDDDTRDDDND